MLSFAKSLGACSLLQFVEQAEASPQGFTLKVQGRELYLLPQKDNFIKTGLRKLQKYSHTGRRKHEFIISREKENYYHPSEW